MTTLLVLTGLAAAVYWIRGLPGIDDLPAWFFRTNRKMPLGPVFLCLVVGAAPLLCRRALTLAAAGQRAQALSLLMLVGIAAQWTIHFLVPEGIEQSFARLFHGHGEFVRVAAARRGLLLPTLRDYDALFASGQLGAFAGSKAPGTLGFYMLVDATAQWQPVQALLAPLIEATRAFPLLQTVPESAALILVLFPVLTYLTLAPLVSLAANLLQDEQTGFEAALLYVTAPGLLLIDLHLDGALYPLLGTSCIALAVDGARNRRPLSSFVGGALGSLGVYCTFGLAPCVALALAFGTLTALQVGVTLQPDAGLPWRQRIQLQDRAPLWSVVSLLAGTGLTLLALVWLLNFQPLVRFEASMAFHAAWKAAVPTSLWRRLSLVEFGVYAGIPLMLALLIAFMNAVVGLLRRRVTLHALWTVAVVAMLAALAITQGTNEVARIWLFVIPLITLAVAGLLRARDQTGESSRALSMTQAALALVMKVRQPW